MKHSFVYKILLLSASILACASLALLTGCKGNTTAAATPEKQAVAPPNIYAAPVTTNPADLDPLTSSIWQNAGWNTLVAPANNSRTTLPVRAAVLFDAANLYVAFVSEKAPEQPAQDYVAIYLDTSVAANGTELMQIAADSTGSSSTMWVRSTTPPDPHADGSPDFQHPQSKLLDVAIKGLKVNTATSTENGTLVWTAVVAIPLRNLPLPLRIVPTPGARLKINLFRTTVHADQGAGPIRLQANLSPVYVGAQSISPKRMSDLLLAPAAFTAAETPAVPAKQF